MVQKNDGVSAFLAHSLSTAEEEKMFTWTDRYGRCSEDIHASISLFEIIQITVGVSLSTENSLG